MTQHTELIERLIGLAETAHSYYEGSSFDAVAKAAFKDALSAALEAQAREIAELKAQESELCTLYGLAEAECKRLRAEMERTTNNRDMWKSQCERQADDLRKLRKDAERVFTYKNQPCDNVIAWRFGEACRAAQPGGDPIDHGLSLLQKLQEKGYGIVAIDAAKEAQP